MTYDNALRNAFIICDTSNPEYSRGVAEFIQLCFGGDVNSILNDIYAYDINKGDN